MVTVVPRVFKSPISKSPNLQIVHVKHVGRNSMWQCVTVPEMLNDTDTDTFTKYFRYRYRYFFRYQIFPILVPRLFPIPILVLIVILDRYYNPSLFTNYKDSIRGGVRMMSTSEKAKRSKGLAGPVPVDVVM